MTLILILGARLAAATPPGPYVDGFVSPARDDAPTDGALLLAANYLVDATVTVGPSAPFPLDVRYVTGVGTVPLVALAAPAGGWLPNETYTVWVAPASGYEDEATLTFTTASGPAPDAAEPVVDAVVLGDWSEPDAYAWGCCEPVRSVQVTAEVPEADPWSWVEIVGQFDLGRPSQITTEEVHTHLDVELGGGVHTLAFEQWADERGPQPPCFDVVAVSASDTRGPSRPFCAIDGPPTATEPPDSTGCAVAGGAPGWMAGLTGLALVWSRRRRLVQ